MLPTLESLHNYKNKDVLKRYNVDYPNNKLTNEQAFNELMKYLWLCEKHRVDQELAPEDEQLNFNCAVHAEMTEIDDMWHTFILFTQDYTNFGYKFFGEYIHHLPNVEDESEEINQQEFSEDFERYLTYIHKHFGEETLEIWFSNLLNPEMDEQHSHHDLVEAVAEAS